MLSHPSTTDTELYKAARKWNLPLNNIVFKDRLDNIHPQKGAYIINLADSKDHGTHWTALYLGAPGEAFYFDSFGIDPPIAVINFSSRYGANHIITSDKEIQDINNGYCGQYCLDFILFMTYTRGSLIERYYKFTQQFMPA